ncbi:hypothetical protein B0H65DRAFT_69946 [Neurospora tetraspora]|uniref:Secreted protein n=1 Tax=Neurospora tetraspora TaxID=94610 RepID=A0AAE0MX57_9PEZI|nr:hypothetical protein B0H65DRAFT_69946 [Neurospora tetraspora]
MSAVPSFLLHSLITASRGASETNVVELVVGYICPVNESQLGLSRSSSSLIITLHILQFQYMSSCPATITQYLSYFTSSSFIPRRRYNSTWLSDFVCLRSHLLFLPQHLPAFQTHFPLRLSLLFLRVLIDEPSPPTVRRFLGIKTRKKYHPGPFHPPRLCPRPIRPSLHHTETFLLVLIECMYETATKENR